MSQHHPSTRRMRDAKATFRAECAADDAPCWLCGTSIDYDAAHDDYDNGERFELDHYYPASTHPQHYDDPANFRASHADCNRERSNDAPRPSIGTTSRRWL